MSCNIDYFIMDDKTIEYYARWEKRFEHLKKKANKVLELGCYKGQTSKWFVDTNILI